MITTLIHDSILNDNFNDISDIIVYFNKKVFKEKEEINKVNISIKSKVIDISVKADIHIDYKYIYLIINLIIIPYFS